MEERLKQRLVGAIVLVSLAVIFVPVLFDRPHEASEESSAAPIPEIPERPRNGFGSSQTITLDLPQTPRLDDEVKRERNRAASNTNAEDRRVSSNALAATSAGSEASASVRAASEDSVSGSTSASSGAAASTKVADTSEPPASGSRVESPSAGSAPAPATRKPDDGSAEKQAVETSATGGWMIQLGSFLKSENALALSKRLQADGYPAFVETGPSAQGEVSRVFVGPIPDREQAKRSAVELRREMALEGIVVPYPGG